MQIDPAQLGKPSEEVARHLEAIRRIGASWHAIEKAKPHFAELIGKLPFHAQNPAIFAHEALVYVCGAIAAGEELRKTLSRFEAAAEQALTFAGNKPPVQIQKLDLPIDLPTDLPTDLREPS